jgi:hypothetical protein
MLNDLEFLISSIREEKYLSGELGQTSKPVSINV